MVNISRRLTCCCCFSVLGRCSCCSCSFSRCRCCLGGGRFWDYRTVLLTCPIILRHGCYNIFLYKKCSTKPTSQVFAASCVHTELLPPSSLQLTMLSNLLLFQVDYRPCLPCTLTARRRWEREKYPESPDL